MPRLPGINHREAVRALLKAGFAIKRESSHIIMAKGNTIVAIPRHNPVAPFTMAGIVADAGLTIEEFKRLLK